MVIAYTLFLLLMSATLFSIENNPGKGLLNLLNVVLIVVPLVSIIFSTIHYYNSYEFIELLLAQPLPRKQLALGQFLGVGAALCLAYLIGVGVPILISSFSIASLSLVGMGLILTLIFVALALLAAVRTRDKARGIGVALLLWFYFALLYNGLVLFLLFAFSDYPLENAVIAFVSFNPIDLGRILVMLHTDASALMGFTGALMQQFFGSGLGVLYALVIMLLWFVLPLWGSVWSFNRKDF
jgi:Cu-processing system permease protein